MSKSVNTAVKTTLVAHTGDVAVRQANVGRGSENVTADDLAIPRIKLLQAISEEVLNGNPKQVTGASAGMLMNSMTNALYTSFFAVNLHFAKKTVAWRKRKMGGGIYDTYSTEAEAVAALTEAGEDIKNFDISENPTHLVMLINEKGEPKGVALIDMPGTKIKVSKRWNSMIAEAEAEGHPRFGCVWHVGVKGESNAQGNFYNLDLLDIADGAKYIVAPQEIYQAAENAFNAFFGTVPAEDEAA